MDDKLPTKTAKFMSLKNLYVYSTCCVAVPVTYGVHRLLYGVRVQLNFRDSLK